MMYMEITFLIFLIGFALVISGPSNEITRNTRVPLPGNEHISKRSIEHPIFKRGIYGGPRHGLRLLPVFGKRSVNEPLSSIKQDFQKSSESLEAAETIIFRPMFRSGLRKARSIDFPAPVLRQLREVSKQDREDNHVDGDLDVAETIIFRPMFRSGLRKARSVENSEDLHSKEAVFPKQPDVSKENMHGAETIVFKPMFRKTRSVQNGDKDGSRQLRDVSKQNPKDNPVEADLDTAETIIFRPMFRSGLRKARSVQNSAEDMETAENGLIFRPLFRSRSGNL